MTRFLPAAARRLKGRVQSLDRLPEFATSAEITELGQRADALREALGRIEARQLQSVRGSLHDHEFRVYSHAGEDGIIQYLIGNVAIANRTFIEFGVQDYRESNTRFLVANDGWRGLVLDGNAADVAAIREDPGYWSWGLVADTAFVTRENINGLLTTHGFTGEIGLLSVDVDGNDYWIFDAIDVVQPAVAIVEYNHRFGPNRSVTIPYQADFARRQTDSSYIASGASLAALVAAAERKGMAFVGCNSFGNNAFFVREALRPPWLASLSASEGFVAGRFREPVLIDGKLVFLSPEQERDWITAAELVEVS